MKITAVYLLFIFALMISSVSATQVCEVYDDFSSGSLNLSKWTESTFHGDPFTDEHFVNSSEGSYHVKQNVAGDAETNLQPNILFNSGDSFSYEAIYHGGSGNHQSQPLINENYPPTQLETCLFLTAGCGPIGYWNDYPDLGAQIGTYKIKFEFSSNEVKMTAIRPDNITVINTFTGNSEPYTLEINTHTGHNGLMHFDFDNFEFCHEEETPIVPEFSTIVLTFTILGTLGIFFLIRKN